MIIWRNGNIEVILYIGAYLFFGFGFEDVNVLFTSGSCVAYFLLYWVHFLLCFWLEFSINLLIEDVQCKEIINTVCKERSKASERRLDSRSAATCPSCNCQTWFAATSPWKVILIYLVYFFSIIFKLLGFIWNI